MGLFSFRTRLHFVHMVFKSARIISIKGVFKGCVEVIQEDRLE